MGPDHPHRREPRDPHGDRLHEPGGPQVLLDVDGLPRLRHLHEGDRPARRPLHHEPDLRHLRRQPLHLLMPEPEHGLLGQAAEARRLRVQPRRVGRLHVRPRDLQRLHGERGLLRADGQGDEPVRAREGRADVGRALATSTATRRSPTSCGRSTRSRGDFYLETLHVARYTREMYCLFGGRHTHPSTIMPGGCSAHITPSDDHGLLRAPDGVLRLRQAHRADARRPLRLLLRGAAGIRRRSASGDTDLVCWGCFDDPDVRRLRLQDDDRVGPEALRHAGRRHRRRARHDRPRRDQRDDPHPPRQLVLRGLAERGRRSSRRIRSAIRSTSGTRGTR